MTEDGVAPNADASGGQVARLFVNLACWSRYNPCVTCPGIFFPARFAALRNFCLGRSFRYLMLPW